MVRENRNVWVGHLPETPREERIPREHFKRSTEDVSPSSFDQRNSGYYERSTRLVTETDAYNLSSRRATTNSYHNHSSNNTTSSELRGSRPREKIYSISRHSTYSSSAVERPTPQHRSSYYDTSPSSDVISGSGHSSPIASRSNSVYTNIQSAVVQPSEPLDCNNSSSNNSNSSKNNNNNNTNHNNKLKSSSRSSAGGSVSPCGSGSGSSSGRIRSRDRDRDRGGGGGGSLPSSISSSATSSTVVPQQQITTTSEQQRDNNRERSNSGSCSSNHNLTPSSHSCSNSSSSNHLHHHHQTTTVDSLAAATTATTTTSTATTTSSQSRSLSRSPSSSYSSTNSISSNSHASSPVSINEPLLLQQHHHNNHHTSSSSTTASSTSVHHHNNCSAVGATIASSASRTKNAAIGSSTTPSSNCNPAVHSEDNRPLAIRVRNLPSRSSDTSLKDGLFHEYKKHGKVTWVKVVGQNAERYALVCFKKPDDVDKALEVSHDKLFFGCKIDVEPYQGYDVEDNEFRPYEAELDEYHPKSTRTLFIGNLEKDITGNELRKHFECFGEIIEIDIKKQGMNAYAFCQYSDIISVVKAMRQMDGEHLGNNRIKLGFGKSMPTNCVWIDGVTEQVGENHIVSQFGRYGTITKIAIDPKRNLALISYEQITFAQLAVKEMRGQRLVAGGRKLQIDFASRECQDAFYEKLDKAQGGGVTNNNSSSSGSGSSRYNRYDQPPQSRSRASSFSRHGAISPSNNSCGSSSGVSPGVGSSTPTTGGTSTGTMSSGVSLLNSATPRGSRTRNPRHPDYEYPERRIRNYDEYSQGSGGASHDEDSYSGYSGSYQRAETPQSRLNSSCNATTPDAIDMLNNGRRRCDKSPSKSKGDTIVSQKERFLLLEQQEECPSSGDELVSPRKRMKFDHSSIHLNNHHHPLLHSECNTNNSLHPTSLGDSNCDVMNNSNNHSSGPLNMAGGVGMNDIHHPPTQSNHNHHIQHANNHRKLSTSSNNSSASGRRPSIDTCPTTNSNASPHHSTSHLPCKRRRVIYHNSVQSSSLQSSSVGSSAGGPNEGGEYHHVSRGRGHQLHSHHSHEASGGESADGSRPGTPLCDELPDAPSEPRRLPTKSSSSETRTRPILTLPLPKFGIPFFQKHRTPAGTLSALASGPLSMTTVNNSCSVNSSSLNSSMVSNSLLNSGDCGPSSHSSLYKQKHQLQHSSTSSSSSMMRPRSLSSNSSDSEPIDDVGIAERIKFVDEMYEKWSGNKDHHHVQHYMQPTQQPPKLLHHKLLEFDIKEVPSSDIAKSLLAKKSIFDDDLQRLANINKKDEAKEEMIPLPKPSIPNLGVTKVPVVGPNPPPLPPPSPIVQPPAAPPTTPYQRLNSSTNSSPMNSPQPSMSSPYNSPSGASGGLRGLQYPFPSHTPIASHSVSPVSSSAAPKITEPQPQKVLNKSNSLPSDVAAPNPKQLKHSSSVGAASTASSTAPATTNQPQPPSQPCPKKSEKNQEKSSHKEKKASKDEDKKEKEKERKERERKERDERERKEREEREQREKEQKERELREQKEKELKEQKERELREQKERELKEQKERELREQRDRELKEQKERELREQREREMKEQMEREQRERELKEQKEKEQRERELKEQREREERDRKRAQMERERELMEQRDRELKDQRERELKEQRERDLKEREQREKELKEQREREQKERDRKLEKSKSESKEEKRNHKANNSSAEPPNPNRNINKRRLSLIDLPLASTYDNINSSKKIRRDSKESLRHNSKERKESSSSSNATPPIEKASSVEQNLLFQPVKVEDMSVPPANRHRKDSGFEEKHGRKHGSKERTPSSSASKHSKSDEEEAGPASSHHSHHKKHKSKKEKKPERVKNSSSCSDSERPPNKPPKTLPSSDSDSDQSSKKKSIFEPNEDSPQYVSMYDKVKARSCKNMQKQVDEKKKKDIFSKFKKIRENKKCRSNEFDSDSHPVTSSDDENSDSARKPFYNQRLTDLWDRESSDEEIPHNHKKRNSLSSKRIESDSDSDADVLQQTVIHVPPMPTEPIDSEDDMKSSPPTPEPKQQTSSHPDFFGDTASNFSDSKEESFDRQVFSPDSKKRHKKSKKRPKCDLQSPSAAEKFENTLLEKKSSAIEDIFDELKRSEPTTNSLTPHDKKQKHKERKEKKRHDRSDPLMSKEERHRLKKLKKAKAAAEQEAKQRGQKFDTIFGPISDDEEVSSYSETPKLLSPPPAPYKQEPLTPKSHTVEENEENKQKCARDPTSHAERERLKKEKREKKRKEREKSKEQHALNSLQHTSSTNNILPPPNKGDDENSVDMDEAGRALEAQLMEDTTADEETNVIGDNFRLSDPDENSIEFRKEEKDGAQSLSGGESGHKHKEDKPRRKKKRKKDRKHESTSSLMSPPSNPYLNIDVSTPCTASKPSPSLPCLDDDVHLSTPTKNSDLSQISPILRDKMLISPIPKTPTISAITPTSSANNSMCSIDGSKVKKLDKLIPGFDVELDEKMSESAVQSISAELNQSPVMDIVPPESKIPVASPPNAGNVQKEEPEEKKSRVVISQEETEDAVAALLGESFGGSTLDYMDDVLPEDEPDPVKLEDPAEMLIPDEDAEEMRKAVQSLSSENIDLKPDTPNSDLQIDTDTEEQGDEEKPVTPIKKEPLVETKPDIKVEIKQEDEKKPLIIKPSVEPKVEIDFNEEKKELPSPKSSAPVIKLEMKEPSRSPVITPKTELPPPATPPMKIELPNRSPTVQFPMQPPTITIPNEGNLFIYPQIMVSPRDQQRMPSPRQQPPVSPIAATSLSQQQMSPQAATGAQFINVRVQSPSQNIPRTNNQPTTPRSQLSPQHMIIQQRQPTSTLSPTGNLVLNSRINIDSNQAEGRTLLVERKQFPGGQSTPQKQIIIQQPVIIKQQPQQNPHQQFIIQQHQIIQRPFQQPQRPQVQHLNIHKPHFNQQPQSTSVRQQSPQQQNVVIVRHAPIQVPQPTKLPQPQQSTISTIKSVNQTPAPQQQTVLIQQTKIPAKIIPPVMEKDKPKMESPSKEVVENNSSVIKSQSAVTPAPPKERENVNKVTLPKENENQQSKEESDFWSAKEANMESVIKEATKALIPNPENSKPGVIAEQPKESGKNNEAPKNVFPTTSAAHPSPAVVRAPPVQTPAPAPTVAAQPPSTPTQSVSAASETDDSENTPEMEIAKSIGKHKKLPRNTKKVVAPVVPEPAPQPEPAGPTRRNATKPAPAGRGRKGRPSLKQQATAPASSQAGSIQAAAERKMRSHSSSEQQDVYEFHEDSGEENPTATNGERPRLIVTIKSPGPSKEAEQEEKEDSSKEDTAHTRKSKRLQGKDRTTIDDTIEDVVRNSVTNANQTRRTTRAAAASLAVKHEEPKKSPRNQKKAKDAKAIDATFDSGDEQPVLPKASPAKVVEQPVEEAPKPEDKKTPEPVSILDPKTGVLSFMGQQPAPQEVPKKEEPPTSVSVVMATPVVKTVPAPAAPVPDTKPTTPPVKLPPKAAHILKQQQLAKQQQLQQQQAQQAQQQAQQVQQAAPQPPSPQVQNIPQKPTPTPQPHPIVIQAPPQAQQPTQNIRQHPLKAHVLNSQKQFQQQQPQVQVSAPQPTVVKPPTPQPTVVKPPTPTEPHAIPKIHQPPVSVHQKVVQHPPHNIGLPLPLNASNLVVHIPPASSPHGSLPSPRMQAQGPPQQQPQQQIQPPLQQQSIKLPQHQAQILTALHGQQSPQIQQQIQQQSIQQQQQAINAKQQQQIMMQKQTVYVQQQPPKQQPQQILNQQQPQIMKQQPQPIHMQMPPHLLQQQSPHTPTKQPSVGVSVVSHQLPPNKQVVSQMQQKVQHKQIPDQTGIVVPTMKPQQQPPPLIGKQVVLPPHHSPHMLTGAVASPPLKQMHMTNQQPIGQGARTAPPPMSSPQGQPRVHIQQQGLTVPPYEMNILETMGKYSSICSQSPPPAHQQTSPGEGAFLNRNLTREQYLLYHEYVRNQNQRIPYIPRSPHLPGTEKEIADLDDAVRPSPPLELRRPGSGPPRPIVAVHPILQSPQDRATDSPQVAQVYVHGTRIPHANFSEFYDMRGMPITEPPPAHMPLPAQPTYAPPQSSPGAPLAHLNLREQREREEREQRERVERELRERELREREQLEREQQERMALVAQNKVIALPNPNGRQIPMAYSPPAQHTLPTLLQRYPVMWQGLLALKTDQAAVQMHFVFGNPLVARGSLPCNEDGTTPPLRIAQRMRLEPVQLDGVAKKINLKSEHCMLLALPCGRDHNDVLQQSQNLKNGFITYLQQKMAAGIINIPLPGSDQTAAYVVHVFPSCEFSNENLERAAPDLKNRVAEIAHLLIVIATV